MEIERERNMRTKATRGDHLVVVQMDLLAFCFLVLSCLVSLECTLWEGFFWRMPKQAYTVPCRASHPHGQGAEVLCTRAISGHCAALTHVFPVLDHKIVEENTIRSLTPCFHMMTSPLVPTAPSGPLAPSSLCCQAAGLGWTSWKRGWRRECGRDKMSKCIKSK